jgi:dihydrofolate synthase/folylpolyglutamate synthase
MELGLENISRLLDSLGNPQNDFEAVLVAGTNGKGSVATYISSILARAGLNVGTFYSPHLFRINERITINGREIPSADLDGYIGILKNHYRKAPFTFFEGVTAAAVLYFLEKGVDLAVFEVGLGGRLDATRLVNALVTVITGISFDHSAHLGRTRKKILNEKLGIVRKDVPLVANLDTQPLRNSAADYCRKAGAPFMDARADTLTRLKEMDFDGMTFSLRTGNCDYGDIRTRMLGSVQRTNLATAVRSLEVLEDLLDLPFREYVRAGAERAFMPGRFQVLTGDPRMILDVSHNEEALIKTLKTLDYVSSPDKNIIVFVCMERKELGRFPKAALQSAREIFLVPLKHQGSASIEKLLGVFKEADSAVRGRGAAFTTVRGMGEAVRKAKRAACPGDCVIFLGSHHTVEEAVAFF